MFLDTPTKGPPRSCHALETAERSEVQHGAERRAMTNGLLEDPDSSPAINKPGVCLLAERENERDTLKVPEVSMTLNKWGHYPKLRCHGPILAGSWTPCFRGVVKRRTLRQPHLPHLLPPGKDLGGVERIKKDESTPLHKIEPQKREAPKGHSNLQSVFWGS